MVLASLGHLVHLSLQWGHQDPMDQERHGFFARLIQMDIRDIISRAKTGSGHPKNTLEIPENHQVPRSSLLSKLDVQMPEHPPAIVDVPVPGVPWGGAGGLLSCHQVLFTVTRLLESVLEITPQ